MREHIGSGEPAVVVRRSRGMREGDVVVVESTRAGFAGDQAVVTTTEGRRLKVPELVLRPLGRRRWRWFS